MKDLSFRARGMGIAYARATYARLQFEYPEEWEATYRELKPDKASREIEEERRLQDTFEAEEKAEAERNRKEEE